MKARVWPIIKAGLIVGVWMVVWGGCSSAKVAPLPPIPPEPPGYVQVPHPEGLDYADLLAIFTDPQAPSPEQLKTCDADFMKLRTMTESKDEIFQGAREFVRDDPVKYHWCFYGKLMELEEYLKSDAYLDERQKHVLDTYLFLTPVARAFIEEYRDTRYLRWASTRYQRISEYVFFRKVQMTEEASSQFTYTDNPFGLLRPSDELRRGVLEKYGLVKPEEQEEEPKTDNMASLPASKAVEVPVQAGIPAAAAASAPVVAAPEKQTQDRQPAMEPAQPAVAPLPASILDVKPEQKAFPVQPDKTLKK